MYDMYQMQKKDIEAINRGIRIARKFENEIFPEGLPGTSVVLYDTKDVLVWTRRKLHLPKYGRSEGYTLYRFAHNQSIKKEDLFYCGGTPEHLIKLLIQKLGKIFFTCSPLTTFVQLQKRRKGSFYTTEASYLATIIHEFAHAYHWLHQGTIPIEKSIWNLLKKLKTKIPKEGICLEAFAIWCELLVSRKYFPAHFRNLKKWSTRVQEMHHLGLGIALKLLKEKQTS